MFGKIQIFSSMDVRRIFWPEVDFSDETLQVTIALVFASAISLIYRVFHAIPSSPYINMSSSSRT
jgi:hypothetical protein